MQTKLTGIMDGMGFGLSGENWETWACLESLHLVGNGSRVGGKEGVWCGN